MFSFLKLFLAVITIAVAYAMTSKEEFKKKPRTQFDKPVQLKAKKTRGPW